MRSGRAGQRVSDCHRLPLKLTSEWGCPGKAPPVMLSFKGQRACLQLCSCWQHQLGLLHVSRRTCVPQQGGIALIQ